MVPQQYGKVKQTKEANGRHISPTIRSVAAIKLYKTWFYSHIYILGGKLCLFIDCL